MVDLERIAAEARNVHIGQALLLVIAAALYLVGFALGFAVTFIGRAVAGSLKALAWSYAALKVGWKDGRRAAGAYR